MSLRRPEVETARKLRRTMSLPEVLLWQRLKGGQSGMSFRKQHPIGPYVADFYHAASKTILEVDGEAHDRGERPLRDTARDAFMSDNGFRVIHLPAADILRNADEVAASIVSLVVSPLHQPSAGPPPRERGGLGL